MSTTTPEKDEEIIINSDPTDEEFEKKLVRKLDLKIMPLLTLLYLLSFLDRVNIGNAKLSHLEKDLGLVNNQYNWCLSIFFIGYILFEVPSNLVLLKTSPSLWIPSMMLAWGIIMSLMAFVRNYAGLLSARFFLGVFESGLFPAIIYYITMWYKRSEQNLRFGFFTIGISCAGSFSGLLAYGIMRLDGNLNLRGWQWLFLVEGLTTILVAGFSYIYISDYPESGDADWLNEKERKFAIERLKEDTGKAHMEHLRFDKKQFYSALKDWKIYTTMFQILGFAIPIFSFSFFLPSIVYGMGFDFVKSQLLSVPPFLCGSVSTFIVAVISDRKRIRGPFIIASSFIGMIGYILLSVPSFSIPVKYFGACVVGTGIYPCLSTSIAWLTNNIPGNVKRSMAAAMMISSGSLGGIFAPQIYRPKDRPHYIFGHLVAMSCLCVTICASVIQYVRLKNINKKKKENPQSFLEGKDDKEIMELGDKHPDFIYSL